MDATILFHPTRDLRVKHIHLKIFYFGPLSKTRDAAFRRDMLYVKLVLFLGHLRVTIQYPTPTAKTSGCKVVCCSSAARQGKSRLKL